MHVRWAKAEAAAVIGKVMGQEVSKLRDRLRLCAAAGSCSKAKNEYEYYGVED